MSVTVPIFCPFLGKQEVLAFLRLVEPQEEGREFCLCQKGRFPLESYFRNAVGGGNSSTMAIVWTMRLNVTHSFKLCESMLDYNVSGVNPRNRSPASLLDPLLINFFALPETCGINSHPNLAASLRPLVTCSLSGA